MTESWESTAESSKQASGAVGGSIRSAAPSAPAQMNSLHALSPLLRRKGNVSQYSPLLVLTKLEWLMGMTHDRHFTWIESVSQIESSGICDIKKKILQTLTDDSFTFKSTYTQNKHVKSILASMSLHHKWYKSTGCMKAISTPTYQSLQKLVSWVFPAVACLWKKDLFKQKQHIWWAVQAWLMMSYFMIYS